jgi:hypothetical protein
MVGNDTLNHVDLLGHQAAEQNQKKRPSPKELIAQLKADFKKRLPELKKMCIQCACCEKSREEHGDTPAAGRDRIRKCEEDIENILKKIEAGWERNCGKGPLPEGSDPVGGYLCYQWSRSFKKWADAGNTNKTWTISEKAAFYKKPGWQEGDGGTVHVWLELIPCKDKYADLCGWDNLGLNVVHIDDGWTKGFNGEFIVTGPHPYDFGIRWRKLPNLPKYPDNTPENRLPENGPK